MMGILVPETCWGNKAAYFVASSWFVTFHYVYDVRSREHQISLKNANRRDPVTETGESWPSQNTNKTFGHNLDQH
jgi:hypothetical protein